MLFFSGTFVNLKFNILPKPTTCCHLLPPILTVYAWMQASRLTIKMKFRETWCSLFVNWLNNHGRMHKVSLNLKLLIKLNFDRFSTLIGWYSTTSERSTEKDHFNIYNSVFMSLCSPPQLSKYASVRDRLRGDLSPASTHRWGRAQKLNPVQLLNAQNLCDRYCTISNHKALTAWAPRGCRPLDDFSNMGITTFCFLI